MQPNIQGGTTVGQAAAGLIVYTDASQCTPPQKFIQLDIRHLPQIWWDILHMSVNDYLAGKESEERYQHALHWLFLEEYDQRLDGEAIDIFSVHVVASAYEFDVGLLRMNLQHLKDGTLVLGSNGDRDARGRKQGYLADTGLRLLVDKSRKIEGEDV